MAGESRSARLLALPSGNGSPMVAAATAIPTQQPRRVRGYVLARYLPGLMMKMSLTGKRLRRALRPGERRDGE